MFEVNNKRAELRLGFLSIEASMATSSFFTNDPYLHKVNHLIENHLFYLSCQQLSPALQSTLHLTYSIVRILCSFGLRKN